MKTVLLMRHAKSSWDYPHLADHARPLNKRGIRDAPRMGRLLADEGLVPDQIICSTATRARLTIEHMLETCPYENEVTFTRTLYHGDIEDYLDALGNLHEGVVIGMLVGHNPDMEYFLETVTGEWARMPTAAIARIEFHVNSWREITECEEVQLLNLWRPKEL